MQDDKKDLSEEDLLKIAEQASLEEEIYIPEETTDVHKFITEFNIRSGNTKVPVGVIYMKYRKWGGEKKPLIFGKIMGQYFKRFRLNSYRGYILDPAPFDLSEENIKKMIRVYKASRVRRLTSKRFQRELTKKLGESIWEDDLAETRRKFKIVTIKPDDDEKT